MNYRTIYKKLNDAGIIDSLINDEVTAGGNLLEIKAEIINGIEYLQQFLKENSFKKMIYWWNTPESIKQRVAQRICKEFARIQIEENIKNNEYYNYMIKA